jgi:hypothetical protein
MREERRATVADETLLAVLLSICASAEDPLARKAFARARSRACR